jgi:hypothetical protein
MQAYWDKAQRLEEIGTWELIDCMSIPHTMKPIPGRWVFDWWKHLNSTPKYKVRWVIRGNLIKGTLYEYGDSYSPVVT